MGAILLLLVNIDPVLKEPKELFCAQTTRLHTYLTVRIDTNANGKNDFGERLV